MHNSGTIITIIFVQNTFLFLNKFKVIDLTICTHINFQFYYVLTSHQCYIGSYNYIIHIVRNIIFVRYMQYDLDTINFILLLSMKDISYLRWRNRHTFQGRKLISTNLLLNGESKYQQDFSYHFLVFKSRNTKAQPLYI